MAEADVIIDALSKSFEKLESALQRQGDERDEEEVLRPFAMAALLEALPAVGRARDFMQDSLRQGTGGYGREHLKFMFGDCIRVAKIHAIAESMKLLIEGTKHEADPRIPQCLAACNAIGQVLKDVGLGAKLGKALNEARSRTQTRVRRSLLGAIDDEDGENAHPVVADLALSGHEVLRLKMLSARELGTSEYRPGDLTLSLAQRMGIKQAAEKPDHTSVYVQLQVGPETRTTEEARSTADQRVVSWDREEHFFNVASTDDLEVSLKVYDRKGARRFLLGDPKIGEAMLSLGAKLREEGSHKFDVQLTRGKGSSTSPAGVLEVEALFVKEYGNTPAFEDYGVMVHKQNAALGWFFRSKEEALAKYKTLPATYACMCVNPDASEIASFPSFGYDLTRFKKEMLQWFITAREQKEKENAEMRLRQGLYLWEFSEGEDFKPYDAVCQDSLESQYQAFVQKGSSFCPVRSRGEDILVDFTAMRERVCVEGDERFREVRRRKGVRGSGYLGRSNNSEMSSANR